MADTLTGDSYTATMITPFGLPHHTLSLKSFGAVPGHAVLMIYGPVHTIVVASISLSLHEYWIWHFSPLDTLQLLWYILFSQLGLSTNDTRQPRSITCLAEVA